MAKATNPVRAEVEAEETGALASRVLRFEFRGVTYEIDGADTDDLELFELIEDGKSITAVRQILGPERWASFKADARNEVGKVTLETFNEFLQAITDVIGGHSGNS